ncbi:MAG: hypothetical protein F6J93_27775 [Oscillatoria sp. SIO1A7]|nr:hypothetical protein [Oscillatoria sp. SIO1A7]
MKTVQVKPSKIVGSGMTLHGTRISSGSGDKSIKSLLKGLPLMSEDMPGATEGSYAQYQSLEPGVYRVSYELRTQGGEEDRAICWNGEELQVVATVKNSATKNFHPDAAGTVEVEVKYGVLIIGVVDTGDKRGETQLDILKIEKLQDLSVSPVSVGLQSDVKTMVGSVKLPTDKKPYLEISCGSKDVPSQVLDTHMQWDSLLQERGTEGSLCTFNVPKGNCEILWQFVSSDKNQNDRFYVWNGAELLDADGYDDADMVRLTRSARISKLRKFEFESDGGQIALVVLDTQNKSGSSYVRVHHVACYPNSEKQAGSQPAVKYPAHTAIAETPMEWASYMYRAYQKHAGYDYSLDAWQKHFDFGYNWYWHQMGPEDPTGTGDGDNRLAMESKNFKLSEALQEESFKAQFFEEIGLQLAELVSDQNPDQLNQLPDMSAEELRSLQINNILMAVETCYRGVSEVGLYNNIDDVILDEVVPNFGEELHTYLERIASSPGWEEVLQELQSGKVEFGEKLLDRIQTYWQDSWGID